MTAMSTLVPPSDAHEWLGLTALPLPVARALDWATQPGCGAVVVFTGTVRDHAEEREGVTRIEYEAYDDQVVPKLGEVAGEVRCRWPTTGRVVLLHRVGDVGLGEPSVVVVVSAPHRAEAFDAARFAIDTLKETVPIWKREFWDDGEDWGLGARAIRPADATTTSADVGS